MLLCASGGAAAMPIDTGTELQTNWDTTVTVSAAHRLNQYSGGLVGDGYAFGAGTATAYDRGRFTPFRLDLLTELDLDYRDFGIKTSALGRVEEMEVPPSGGTPYLGCSATSGRDSCNFGRGEVELLDAFFHGATAIGEDQRVAFRIGRYTLLWGESLFFPNNGIAAGQAPIDPSLPGEIGGYPVSEEFLPVGQASFSWEPTSAITLEVYDQFEWRRSRVDLFNPANAETPDSTDQYGAALRWHHSSFDYGLYALSFDAKTPVLHFQPNSSFNGTAYNGTSGVFREQFPTGIQIFGASIAGPLGAATFGGEISARRNMPLVTGVVLSGANPAGNSAYPAGDTWHAQFSWNYVTPPLPGIPAGAIWSGEVAANGLIATTENAALLTLDRTRYAAAFRTIVEPQFLQVVPRVDISVPIGVGYNFLGLSPVDPAMNRGTGDVSIGLTATFDRVWKTALTFTHYFGTAKNTFPYNFVPAGRPLANADFVSFSVQRTF